MAKINDPIVGGGSLALVHTILIKLRSHPIVVAVTLVWSVWLIGMLFFDLAHHLSKGWPLAVTMIFGSFIAGATSEGGGAVAFPVMTLILGIPPDVARDFSLMCQAVGMTSASFSILCLGIQVSKRSILIAGLGGMFGVVVGMTYIAPLLAPAYTKIFFTSFWLSFAFALYLINRDHARQVNEHMPARNPAGYATLFLVGLIGGMVSGLAGSGLDITTFAFLVLAMRMCEKVATPTSVILMASNSLFAFFWRSFVAAEPMAEAAWSYWYAAVPVACLMAPLGAMFIRDKSRHFVASILYVSIFAQFIGALLIVPMTPNLIAFCIATLSGGGLLFWLAARLGRRFAPLVTQDGTV